MKHEILYENSKTLVKVSIYILIFSVGISSMQIINLSLPSSGAFSKESSENNLVGRLQVGTRYSTHPGLYSSGISGMSTRSITAATTTKMAGTSQPTAKARRTNESCCHEKTTNETFPARYLHLLHLFFIQTLYGFVFTASSWRCSLGKLCI